MKFMLLMCVDPNVEVIGAEPVEPWVEEMDRRGVRLSGNRLQPVSDATTVRVRDGDTLITDGPYAETKEQIAGYDIVECASVQEAVEVAAKHPVATFGVVEVRPFWT